MTARKTEIAEFLQKTGWGDAAATPLKSDASNRRYIRLLKNNNVKNNTSRMLMDADPDLGEDVRPFIHITDLLHQRGLSAPQIYHSDETRGFLLIEDFGDTLFKTLCDSSPRHEIPLYQAAIDLLIALHNTAPPKNLAPYDDKTYRREAALLTQWYLPAMDGDASNKARYETLMNAVCAPIKNTPPCLVLRDYHAENLMWLDGRAGIARVGLLDYQDALLGHPAYDLVSLLMDARRDTSADLQGAMLTRYLDGRGIAQNNRASFHSAYHRLGAQRGCKVLGIFARLCLRDGKAHYADLMPRVWQHLQNNLTHPDCADLRDWIDNHIPAPTKSNLTALKNRAKRAVR